MGKSSQLKSFYQFLGITAVVFATACSSSQPKPNSDSGSNGAPASADAPSIPANSGNGSPADFDRGGNKNASSPNSVQPGYEYEVSSPSDGGINGKFRVEFEGKLRLAYNVVIDTTGLSESELRAKVINAYRPYLKNADSTRVVLAQRKLWVDIRGLVVKPGRYLIGADASLDEILNQAGSLQVNGQAEYVQVQLPNQNDVPVPPISLKEYYDTGNSSLIPKWQGGSVLFVQRKNEVTNTLTSTSHPAIQIYGEVRNPGELTYRDDADFLYYLTKAGGPSPVADLTKIDVIRWVSGHRQNTRYNWEESHQLTHLEPNDLVVIQSNQLTPFEKAMQAAGGLGGILSAIGILIIAL
jgi:hypothetical protein